MIAHTALRVGAYATAKEFYAKALAPLGYELKRDFPEYKTAGFMQGGNTDFWIGEKEGAGDHVAFLAETHEKVKAFYDAALAAGGKDNGAPGWRPDYGPEYYAAFVLDPWGNNIEACNFSEKMPGA